ncbi:protein of unknown function [Micropruina glycogenica]|uniref:Uncharacterized protein n=1 Tax=Micropruina glycogenica TaxID=75385 RepID=A0A2N9JLC0_9ACTN|nr:protein of unknown function [Micropruina glycogenica]
MPAPGGPPRATSGHEGRECRAGTPGRSGHPAQSAIDRRGAGGLGRSRARADLGRPHSLTKIPTFAGMTTVRVFPIVRTAGISSVTYRRPSW